MFKAPPNRTYHKSTKRKQIDPTTCERDYSADEIEFMQALESYKKSSGRKFPTCSEILEVVRSLGYERTVKSTSAMNPASAEDSASSVQSASSEQSAWLEQGSLLDPSQSYQTAVASRTIQDVVACAELTLASIDHQLSTL